ncbi:MAG: helix-turn-helix domain-containing protein [Gemmatimonadota bacterium]|nr:helix-turn-helix domain-containing protein [Gemmatimonadota bacterium]
MPDLDRRPAHRLTHAQAAELLGVHPITVAQMVTQGRLTPVKRWAKAGLLHADVERQSLERVEARRRVVAHHDKLPRCSM